MFTTSTTQDFESAFHAAGCTTTNCNVVAGHKDAEGLLEEEQWRDGLRGKENEAELKKEEHDDSDKWTLVDRTISMLVASRAMVRRNEVSN